MTRRHGEIARDDLKRKYSGKKTAAQDRCSTGMRVRQGRDVLAAER
jgi:hypothetical protein